MQISKLWLGLMLLAPSAANAQYRIELRNFAEGVQSHAPGFDTVQFQFMPNVSIFEETANSVFVKSTAFATLASPNDFFIGYDNHPQGSSAVLLAQPATSDVVSEVNGTWQLQIEEQDAIYNYEVDVTFTLPFDKLPHFTSTTLVNGSPAGPFTWALEGGSAQYPGNSNQLFTANLYTTSFQPLASAFLPAGTSQWTPPVSLTGGEDFIGQIGTFVVAYDLDAFQVGEIRPITPGAPSLAFGLTTVEYRASLTARLTPLAVPEPGTMLLLIVGFVGCVLFRCGFAGDKSSPLK